jgi:hypothetical protein
MVSNPPKNRLYKKNYAIAKFLEDNTNPLNPILDLEEYYSYRKNNVAINYLYDRTSLFYNSTVITDFSGPNLEIKYQDVVEGQYNFTLELKNEQYDGSKKIAKTKSKNFVVNIKPTKHLNIENRPFKEFPQDVPSGEIPITRYVKFDGPLVFLDVRHEVDKDWINVNQRFRMLEDSKDNSKN